MCVPENYDFFIEHDARQTALLERCPKCEHCGEPIQDDYLYDVDGVVLCEECMKDLFRKDREDYERRM